MSKKTRSIFEDVGTPPGQNAQAAPVQPERLSLQNRRAVARWLFALAALVILMIIIGGLTRLTDSGLSITEWAPITGTLPPLSTEQWQAEFAKYRAIPEFTEQNSWMGLEDFKHIYWWEWGHRFLGRVIGLAFLLPFLYFLIRGMIPRGWSGRLLLILALGGLQGFIGWWMVSSGLSERVDVAPYRLAVHLGMAFVILALLLWSGLTLWREYPELIGARRARNKRLMALAGATTGLIFLQILVGALLAGVDGGKEFTDWPLMGGQVFPSGYERAASGLFNLFEDAGVIQFIHRLLAYGLAVLALVFFLKLRQSANNAARAWGMFFFHALVLQVILGIITLMQAAPLHLSILHQITAIAVFVLILCTKHEIAYPKAEKISG